MNIKINIKYTNFNNITSWGESLSDVRTSPQYGFHKINEHRNGKRTSLLQI